eukprot:scaffold8018_cov109-Isochrysis_galbana.AAC.1
MAAIAHCCASGGASPAPTPCPARDVLYSSSAEAKSWWAMASASRPVARMAASLTRLANSAPHRPPVLAATRRIVWGVERGAGEGDGVGVLRDGWWCTGGGGGGGEGYGMKEMVGSSSWATFESGSPPLAPGGWRADSSLT